MTAGRPPKMSAQQMVEVRVLVANGARRASVAVEYGVSEGTISRVVGIVHGRIGRPTLRPQACDRCGTTERRVERFTLVKSTRRRHSSRGAGAIDLCEPCWRRTAARRRAFRVTPPSESGQPALAASA